MDRFHLVADMIDRVPKLQSTAACAKQAMTQYFVSRHLIRRYCRTVIRHPSHK